MTGDRFRGHLSRVTRDDSLVTLILCVDSQNNNLHYLQDHLNSPIRLLSTDSETPLAYDEFGVPTTDSMPNTNPFGFTGYQLDEITNMHYAQARYYNSTTGRFTAEDPIKDKLNWYGYCNANPNTSIDPTGLFVMPGGGGTWEQTIDDYYPSKNITAHYETSDDRFPGDMMSIVHDIIIKGYSV